VTTSLLKRPVVSDASNSAVGAPPLTFKRTPVRSAVGRSFGKWIAVIAVLVVLGLAGVVGQLLKDINPLAVKKVDRTQPALLSAISNLSDYRAASAQFTVVVDIEDDAKWLPAAVRGERTVMLASGSVDAGVNLAGLDSSALTIDEATKSVVMRLPHATLRKAQLDLANTTVVQHKRGLLDRVGSAIGDAPKGENKALRIAQTKLEKAAKESTVLTVAEANTTTMMTSLVRGLGYNTVRVEFV
jgi:Protein of unknown function (DUF4230)